MSYLSGMSAFLSYLFGSSLTITTTDAPAPETNDKRVHPPSVASDNVTSAAEETIEPGHVAIITIPAEAPSSEMSATTTPARVLVVMANGEQIPSGITPSDVIALAELSLGVRLRHVTAADWCFETSHDDWTSLVGKELTIRRSRLALIDAATAKAVVPRDTWMTVDPTAVHIYHDAENQTLSNRLDAPRLYRSLIQACLECAVGPQRAAALDPFRSVTVAWHLVIAPRLGSVSQQTLEAFSDLGVRHVTPSRKEGAVDTAIKRMIAHFIASAPSAASGVAPAPAPASSSAPSVAAPADEWLARQLVVIISGDRDFAGEIIALRRAGFAVVLMHDGRARSTLRDIVRSCNGFDCPRWKQLVADATTGPSTNGSTRSRHALRQTGSPGDAAGVGACGEPSDADSILFGAKRRRPEKGGSKATLPIEGRIITTIVLSAAKAAFVTEHRLSALQTLLPPSVRVSMEELKTRYRGVKLSVRALATADVSVEIEDAVRKAVLAVTSSIIEEPPVAMIGVSGYSLTQDDNLRRALVRAGATMYVATTLVTGKSDRFRLGMSVPLTWDAPRIQAFVLEKYGVRLWRVHRTTTQIPQLNARMVELVVDKVQDGCTRAQAVRRLLESAPNYVGDSAPYVCVRFSDTSAIVTLVHQAGTAVDDISAALASVWERAFEHSVARSPTPVGARLPVSAASAESLGGGAPSPLGLRVPGVVKRQRVDQTTTSTLLTT